MKGMSHATQRYLVNKVLYLTLPTVYSWLSRCTIDNYRPLCLCFSDQQSKASFLLREKKKQHKQLASESFPREDGRHSFKFISSNCPTP